MSLHETEMSLHAEIVALREQQAATSELLRVISRSPSDLQPVFDAIARHSVTLCGALYSAVFRFDGTLIHVAAHHNWTPKALREFEEPTRYRPATGVSSPRAS
jgi:hypothetical protein